MANQATINTLVPVVRARLAQANTATISDADVKTFLRSSCAQLYEIIANRHRDYYVTPYKFSFATNQDRYPLPADFRSAVQVFVTFGNPPNVQRLPLEQFTLNRYQTRTLSSLLMPQWPTMYRIMGSDIYFTPAPSQNYLNAVELWYVPQWPGIASDDQTIDGTLPNGWERWVEFDTCVQIASRLRWPEYYATYTQERERIEQAVIKAASIRDEQPEYMTDAFDVPWFGLNRPGEQ